MERRILAVLGSGGHTAQMLKLLDLLGDRYVYEFAISDNDMLSIKKVTGKVYILPNPRNYMDSTIRKVLKLIVGFLISYRILRESRPRAVISSGPGLTIPLFIVARFLRIQTVFLESWCRVTSKSLSGRICYPFSDLFFVQWEKMQRLYPKAIYAGRLS